MTNSRDGDYQDWQSASGSPFHSGDEDSDVDPELDDYYIRRNILIFDEQDTLIAGLEQRGSFTVSTVYRWMDILYPLPDAWLFRSKTGEVISRDQQTPFPLGSYQIADQGSRILSPLPKSTQYIYRCLVNNHRRFTYSDDELFKRVQRRDGRCLITGKESSTFPKRSGQFQSSFAVRIFPLVSPVEWNNPSIRGLFKELADSPESFAQVLQSPVNAFICNYTSSQGFNGHWFSIDVDDDHRVVQFVDCKQWRVPRDGRLFASQGENPEPGPSDLLFRTHFHQALIRWILHNPAEHKDFRTATRLALQIQNREASPHEVCWTREPGKSVFESYMAQQLLGCCVELGNEFQDRFKRPSEPEQIHPWSPAVDRPTVPRPSGISSVNWSTVQKIPDTPPSPRVKEGRYYSDSD
ncbi:hypothetical protein SISSUDRAFT_1052981 [Sistotremastrum suecicum HHB10207 ss-3]|uniref:HNH nuclease domain-containing protein n=1 Tax=Sistotremastrum suecicum HHB10207 ss-3 TaxID=1314776 RepID=A0A165ZI57_9AGAM|nr:hypothetical protein SISSUDRAFT_1052981 [Sistotremastrum suecicum HHB10207 ss-3]